MKKKVLGALAIGAASVGLIVLGTGTASAANPACLVESAQGAVADPSGVVGSTLADPVGAVGADVACVKEVVGG